MNLEKLISLVHERRALWDTSIKSYHNRDIGRLLWKEIAEIMNVESGDVKGKWANLRDTFRREHMKQLNQPTGSGAKRVPLWKYYEQLLFLGDVFKPREMKSNIHPSSNEYSSEETALKEQIEKDEVMEASNFKEDCQIVDDSNSSTKAFTITAPKVKKAKITKSNGITEFLALEKRKIEQLEKMKVTPKSSEEVKDEDYFFLMSLLPHFRAIPKYRKLAVRTEIQQVLIEEESNRQEASPVSSSPEFIY